MAVATERSLSMVNAVGEAMRQAMEADPTVIVMGEDVVGGAGRGGSKENAMGGSFGATKSLYPLFGGTRVRDTPISYAVFCLKKKTAEQQAVVGRQPKITKK